VKILKANNIIKFILTTVSILKIFIISFIKFYKNKSSKFIFFYFPVRAYQENIIDLIDELNKHSNVYTYIIYNSFTSNELKNKKNSLFIDFGYLRFVPLANFFLSKINFLISSYVIYVFLPNTKNIYISHDIYDTPMVNKIVEKDLFLSLSKLDYIFVSSNVVKKYFEQTIKKYLKYNINKKKAKIINTGYMKLDHVSLLLKKLKKVKNKFCILIAPTASKHYNQENLSLNLDSIINFLVKNKYEIIYRPHPMDLTIKGNLNLIKKITNKYKKFENFKLDTTPSYIESYKVSDVLLTDFSGTAYTYAFSKNSPVIFFSKNANDQLSNDFKKLYYFKDRHKIGYVVNNFLILKRKLDKIKKNKNIFFDRIKKLRSKRIQYFNNSLYKTKDSLIKLFK
jgi:hypothetical protein